MAMKILEPLESLLNRMQSHELQDTNDPAEREAPERDGVGPIIRQGIEKADNRKGFGWDAKAIRYEHDAIERKEMKVKICKCLMKWHLQFS